MNKSILAVSIALIAGTAQADIIDPSNVQDAMTIGRVAVNAEGVTQEQRDQVAYMVEAVSGYAEALDNLNEAEADVARIQGELNVAIAERDQAYRDLDIANGEHRQQILELEAKVDALEAELEVAVNARIAAEAARATAEAARQVAEQAADEAVAAQIEAEAAQAAAEQDAQEAQDAQADAEAAQSEAEAQRDAAQDQQEAAEQELAETEADLAEANDTISEKDAYIQQLLAQIEELEAEPEPAPEPEYDEDATINALTDTSYEETVGTSGHGFYLYDRFTYTPGGDHGDRVMEAGQELIDSNTMVHTISVRSGYLRYELEGKDAPADMAGILKVAKKVDGDLGIFATSRVSSGSWKPGRENRNDDNIHAWDILDNGVQVHRAGRRIAKYLDSANTLVMYSLENSTDAADTCDADLAAPLEEGDIPECGDFSHAAAASENGLDQIIFVGAFTQTNGDLRAQAAIAADGVYAENTIYFISDDGSTSHASGVAGAVASREAAENGIVDAATLKTHLMSIAETLTVTYVTPNGGEETRTVKVIRN